MVSVQGSIQKPNECAEINAWGTAIVLEEAARARVKKLIFSSSAAIYGVLAYPAILRAIEMVGRQNVYFVIFEDNRFILDAMEIIPCVNASTTGNRSAATIFACKQSQLMMFLKKLPAFTILLRRRHPEISLPE